MKLIDKDALVAEIEKTYKFHEKRGNEHDSSICDVLYGLSHRINTLEVKEVGLEKEIQDIFQRYKNGYNGLLICKKEDFSVIAKHFFELGLNASNPLTWEDIKTIQNISHEVYEEVAKGKDDFYLIYPTEQSFLEEVSKRFKAQKGDEV